MVPRKANVQKVGVLSENAKRVEENVPVAKPTTRKKRSVHTETAPEYRTEPDISGAVPEPDTRVDVTIIIPARLRTDEDIKWLKEALDSVEAQTVKCDCIIVLNGCTVTYPYSTPHNFKFIASAEGLSVARNKGVAECRTPFFFPLDANDWLPPNAIETALLHMPEKGFVYGSTMLFRGERNTGDQHLYYAKEYDFGELMQFVYFPNGALQRKSDWERIGGWREDLPFLEDWDYWLTAGELGICGTAIQNVLYWYRQHDGLVSTNKNTVEWEKVKLRIKQLHSGIYKGEFPMACCGGKAKTTKQSTPVTYRASAPIAGTDGLVLIKYVGSNVGTMTWFGAVTGTHYEAGGNKPEIYVDTRDAYTGIQKNPGFLELVSHGKHIFEEVKE